MYPKLMAHDKDIAQLQSEVAQLKSERKQWEEAYRVQIKDDIASEVKIQTAAQIKTEGQQWEEAHRVQMKDSIATEVKTQTAAVLKQAQDGGKLKDALNRP